MFEAAVQLRRDLLMFEAAVQLRRHLLIFEATVLLRQHLLITEATIQLRRHLLVTEASFICHIPKRHHHHQPSPTCCNLGQLDVIELENYPQLSGVTLMTKE